ncbi:hypothetical protein ONZ45_g746 [Pleurotus djamor]|nr:hypothetical protein ONZ45_g746 [Pleurotus djamor]
MSVVEDKLEEGRQGARSPTASTRNNANNANDVAPCETLLVTSHHYPEKSSFHPLTPPYLFDSRFSERRSVSDFISSYFLDFNFAACYKYAPAADEDAYLTRWIALYSVPRDVWLNLNVKHTAMQQTVSEQNLLVADAQLPKVHRFRYPQLLDQASPFLTPVGLDVDNSKIAVERG